MREDNKNLLLAIVLSVAVLLGWNYFFAAPQVERQRQAQNQPPPSPTVPTPGVPVPGSPTPSIGGPSAPVPGTTPGATVESRESVLARSPRVRIETPTKVGSINLRGARIDDLTLKNYRETIQSQSPNIVLFAPAGSPNPYFADFGWGGAGAPGEDAVWTADRDLLTPQTPVTLTYDNGQGLVFRRQIGVDAESMFTVRDSVENRSGQAVALQPYGRVVRTGKPQTLGFFVLHEGLIGVLGKEGLQEYTYDGIEKETAVGANTRRKEWKGVTGGFVGITDKYWAGALVPDQAKPFDGYFEALLGPTRTYQTVAVEPAQSVAPGTTAEVTRRLFAGAKEVATIDGYAEAFKIDRFDRLIDWGWFPFLTRPMFAGLDFFYRLVGNFGVSILIVTVILKLLFFPLQSKSYASMAKMKAVQPEMLAIRDRYADDKVKQQQALMELYKKEKINPIAGCWPVLIQIPIFFALYKVLFITIEMRHQPFFGWIQDLAAPDPTSIFNLFGLLPYNPGAVPLLGPFLMLGIWPLVMGVTMWLQMKMNPEPTDPIQKQVFGWMPIIFTFMLASFPAGLVIYWAWNNFLSIAQQYFIMRKHGVKVELWDNLRSTFAPKKAGAKG